TRTVRLILPFGAASATDITARLLAGRLSTRWGKPVVVENRAGGDGLVAINAFLGARDDHAVFRPGRDIPGPSLRRGEAVLRSARHRADRPNLRPRAGDLGADVARYQLDGRAGRASARTTGQTQRRRRHRQFGLSDLRLHQIDGPANRESAYRDI